MVLWARGALGDEFAGFVNCSAALVRPDGPILFANAGHPSPFEEAQGVGVNGYEEATSHGARLRMVSDGVGEAENPRWELFGFERTRWAKPPGRGAKPMTVRW
jgi:hypothetical protein